MNLRFFYNDNGTVSDKTVDVNSYHSGTINFPYVVSQDYFYIGSKLPLNHIYFKLGTVNINAATMSVHYWDGDTWRAAAEVTDETALGGASFGQSGFVTFVPNKDYKWAMESTNYNGDTVTGLSTVSVYDRYWTRISFSASLEGAAAATVTLAWAGNKFADDNDLGSEFPDLDRTNVKTAFESGKTTWEEQHVKAAEILIQDLINDGVVKNSAQILTREDYRNAAVYKCAEIIYRSFGKDYEETVQGVRQEYKLRIAKKQHAVDNNANALEDVSERYKKSGFLSR